MELKKFIIAAYGEILWDILPDATVLGGAPFNFIHRINSLGHKGYMISAVGKDSLGEKALNRLTEMNITDRYIQIKENLPTGTVNVFFDENKNPDYEIIKGVAYDFIDYNQELEFLISQVDCICFGTLSQRNSISGQTLRKLLKHFSGKFRLYDLNLRKDCFSVRNIISSLRNTDILKVNRQEAGELKKILRLKSHDLTEFCKEVISSFELQYCVVTLEEYGSLAVSSKGEVVYSPGFEIKLVDPLGSGDAFSAGFVDALLHGKSLTEASEAGNLLGAIVASQKGATQKISLNDLNQIALQNNRVVDENFNKKNEIYLS